MKLYQVDAFTNEPFKGNGAGVHISQKPLDVLIMQQIASEINMAETAFVYPSDAAYEIRFFTPTVEVPICGHATLSAAHIMYEQGLVAADATISFRAKAGPLSVVKQDEWYVLDFPAYASHEEAHTSDFTATTGIQPVKLYKSENGWFIAVLDSEASVQACKPHLSRMEHLPPVLVTAPGDSFDYVMRLFAPGSGIPEDPVTGSAECVLGPLWSKTLDKDTFEVKQLSQRTGIKKVKLNGDRVLISGQAVTVFDIDARF